MKIGNKNIQISIDNLLKLLLVLICANSYSQNDKTGLGRFRYVEVRGHTGFHAYTGNDDLKTFMESGYGSVEVRFGWQPYGEGHWSEQYAYPSYGFGLYKGFLGSPEIFGEPSALYGFIKFHLTDDHRRNIFSIEPAFGLTYNLEPYNPDTNPFNNAIGARMAIYFNLKFGWSYKWTREMDVTYGFDATHMSNGRTFTPNWGLNMLGINLGVSYNYNPDQRKISNDVYSSTNLLPVRYKRPGKKKNTKYTQNNNFINVYGAISTVQTYEDVGTDKRFMAYSVVSEFQHKFNNMHSVSAGLDYFFDGSLEEKYPDNPSKRNHYGIHGGYDFMFYKFTIVGQIGVYLNKNETKPFYFFRPALRYNVADWFYLQLGLKARGFAADWVEAGLGFRPFNW
ncbi:acyloxyacyl hydrolase [Tenacibaculum sp. UWU-22]|uniref:acyloxyacyl hydrolase n=1 Tax=Tenacibaculum sp. UWU-22 TaxID=3234187 RepID=UPI0034DB08D9